MMRALRTLIVIPAYNEADSLPSVIADLRAHVPAMDVLVVDDGSADRTPAVLEALCSASGDQRVRALRLARRSSTGVAVLRGLQFAVSEGYDAVVRVDGDGQHPAWLIAPLMGVIERGDADIVVGSRYALHPRPTSVPFIRRLMHYLLGRILSWMTGRLVTDPTSGLWAFSGPALKLLATAHPSGYPEPELILLANRERLRLAEVPVEMRERLRGRRR